MRRFSFLEWLDDATNGPVGHVVKSIVAGLLLLSFVVLGYRFVREGLAEQAATNARIERDLHRK